jgi:hypothetical protein
MTEHEMEDLLWGWPERFLDEPLKPFRRQPHTDICRPDLIFETRIGQLLVVEIKKGSVGRDAIGQICDYFGALKQEFPGRSVELMLVGGEIHSERKIALDQLHLEWREIPLRRFRAVAREVGYIVESEMGLHGSGDFTEFGGGFGMIAATYGDDGNRGEIYQPGEFLAVIREIVDHNRLDVEFFYAPADEEPPECLTLVLDRQGEWRDFAYDAPISIDFQPTTVKVETLKRYMTL